MGSTLAERLLPKSGDLYHDEATAGESRSRAGRSTHRALLEYRVPFIKLGIFV